MSRALLPALPVSLPKSVVTHFQPILSHRQKSMVGLEALSRGAFPDAGMMAAGALFKMARESGTTDELESLCQREAVRRFAGLTDRSADLILFLNFGAAGVEPASMTLDLKTLVTSAGLSPSNVAVEILESEIPGMRDVQTLIGLLRSEGFLIALDDMGAGHSNLDRVPIIKPDLLKIDRALVAHIEDDYYKRGAFKSLVDLSRKIGALVVAEGIETEDEALVCLELGADLVQGYWLCNPGHYESARHDGLAAACHRIESLAMKFRSHMVATINERKVQHRQFTTVMDRILRDLTATGEDEFDDILSRTVPAYPRVECVYVLDQLGIQVTETVCHPRMRRRAHEVLFRPAPKGTDHSLKEYYFVLLDVELRRYTTDPYVSMASGSMSQTISIQFRDARSRAYILCIDVLCE